MDSETHLQDIKTCRVGDQGQATSPLTPSGMVEINGSDFTARVVGGAVEVGAQVIVMEGDVSGLVVRAVSTTLIAESLPNYGKPVFDSFGDKARAKAAKEELERQEALSAWNRIAVRRQLQLGVCFGFAIIWLLYPVLVVMELGFASQVVYRLCIFASALIWAILVFRSIEHILVQFDEDFLRLVTPSTFFALVGSAIGIWCISSVGVTMGLGVAIAGAIGGAFIVPLLATLFLGDG